MVYCFFIDIITHLTKQPVSEQYSSPSGGSAHAELPQRYFACANLSFAMKPSIWLLSAGLALLFSCQPGDRSQGSSDQASTISYNLPEGYELEVLYAPKEHQHGSWVSLAEAPGGIMYASDQWGDLYQFPIPAIGETLDTTQVQPLPLDIGNAQGLLWAFNSLYVSVNERWVQNGTTIEHGSGVYRLQDSDQDGQLDQIEPLIRLEGEGEHGPHSLILSPDQQHIYFIAGNMTKVPEAVASNSRQPRHWATDNLLPPYLDARGHAHDVQPPGGWVARFEPDGSNWELYCSGFRNPYDFGFNPAGELFVFDSDMEWDIGMPWYRPIRVCHAVSGGEFGWRTGSGKWPAYYPDNLPPVIELGQGSPTAVVMGSDLNFPARYQQGMFVFDWSFGTIYFVDLQARGSSYTANKEEFFSGSPLPLTDGIAGSDGALYFATGGRNLNSHLYRLRYTGTADSEPEPVEAAMASDLRQLRQTLAETHQPGTGEQIDLLWQHLNHPDRFIRYTARIGLEHQPAHLIQQQLSSAQQPERIIQASMALARKKVASAKNTIYTQLTKIDFSTLPPDLQLDYLRAVALTSIRLGDPDRQQQQQLVQAFGEAFPSGDFAMDRELSQLLVYFKVPEATAQSVALLEKYTADRTLTHPDLIDTTVAGRSEQYGEVITDMLANMPPTEAIFYATLLSHAQSGWTDSLRSSYFSWFFDVLGSSGGMSFKPFIENIRQKAMQQVPAEQTEKYEAISGIYHPGDALANLPQAAGPGKAYSSAELFAILNQGFHDYQGDIEQGQLIYQAALCATCHRMRGEGGNIGPDLTQLHSRFGGYEMVIAIFSPHDQISDQYANTRFDLNDGSQVTGKLISETDEQYLVQPNPYDATQITRLAKSEVQTTGRSPFSPMPPGLLNRLNESEIRDLLAYLMAGGDPDHSFYQKDNSSD